MRSIFKWTLRIVGILVGLFVVFSIALIVYMNIDSREVEKTCEYIEKNRTNPNVLKEVREANFVGPDFENPGVILHVYSVSFLLGPTCAVKTSPDGNILSVTFLPD